MDQGNLVPFHFSDWILEWRDIGLAHKNQPIESVYN